MAERKRDISEKSPEKIAKLLARFYGGDVDASLLAVNNFLETNPDAKASHVFNALSSGLGMSRYHDSGNMGEGQLFPNKKKSRRGRKRW